MKGKIKVNIDELEYNGEDRYLRSTEQPMYLSSLGGVCTGRLLQYFPPDKDKCLAALKYWVDWMKCVQERDIDTGRCRVLNSRVEAWSAFNHMLYLPQMVVCVTNARQEGAQEALLEFGFQPSQPVNNGKYGSDYNLTTWTYELFPATKAGKEPPSAD